MNLSRDKVKSLKDLAAANRYILITDKVTTVGIEKFEGLTGLMQLTYMKETRSQLDTQIKKAEKDLGIVNKTVKKAQFKPTPKKSNKK